MIAAVMHGGAGPWWLGVLIAAKEWGTPPWQIADGLPVVWYLRWVEYQHLVQKKHEADSKKWRKNK